MSKPSRKLMMQCIPRRSCTIFPSTCTRSFSKPAIEDAKLVVLAHVDVKRLRFRKVEGRNDNVLNLRVGFVQSQWQFRSGNREDSDHEIER